MWYSYQMARYQDGGRDKGAFDCWGLVRHALHHVYGLPLLPSFGNVCPDNKDAMTHLADTIYPVVTERPPQASAIAAAYQGGLLIHVGLCISDTQIIHTSRKHGTCINSLRDFARLSGNVRYYKCQK